MGTRIKFATWYKDGKLFRVKPPDWPKQVEYSCTEREDLIAWAQNHHYMLRQVEHRREYA